MKKVILFASVLLFICATSITDKGQSFDSRFEISFKVLSNNKTYKTTNTQIVINHEEQYSNFDAFKAKVKHHNVLRFDGKSVGNTFQWKSIKKGSSLDDFTIKSLGSNNSITLKGVTVKSIKKNGKNFLSEIEYLSAH